MTKNIVLPTSSLGVMFICMLLFSPLPPAEAKTYQPRRSHIVKAFKYSEELQALTIYFLNGDIHEYQSVPVTIYHGLKDAPLKGGYFQTWIQDQFKKTDLHTPTMTPQTNAGTESKESE